MPSLPTCFSSLASPSPWQQGQSTLGEGPQALSATSKGAPPVPLTLLPSGQGVGGGQAWLPASSVLVHEVI